MSRARGPVALARLRTLGVPVADAVDAAFARPRGVARADAMTVRAVALPPGAPLRPAAAVLVSKRHGGKRAVDRNRIRRRLWSALALAVPGGAPLPVYLVVQGGSPALHVPFAQLVADLRGCLAQLRVLPAAAVAADGARELVATPVETESIVRS